MSANRFLLQYIADVTGRHLRVASQSELSATGVAWMGLLATGQQTLKTLAVLPQPCVDYAPSQNQTSAQADYAGWKTAVQAVLPPSWRKLQ